MAEAGTKTRGNNLILLLFSFIILASITGLNIFYTSNTNSIILYLIGSIFYYLYLKINKYDLQYSSDYIQNGEGGTGLLFTIILLKFATDNLYIIFLITLIIIVMYELFIKRILFHSNEMITIGTYINITVVLVIIFLLSKDSQLHSTVISKAILGYAHNFHFSIIHFSVLMIIALIPAIILWKFNNELKLYSHGNDYFNISSINYNYIRIFTIIFRSFLITIIILTLGLAGGIGYYLMTKKMENVFESGLYMAIAIYTQLLILLNHSFSNYSIAIISIFFSYFLYMINIKRRIYLYDRN